MRANAQPLASNQSDNDRLAMEKWRELEDVPFDEADTPSGLVLAEDWWIFSKGTDREEIWRHFDELYSKGVAALLHGEEKKEK